jgi:hypothetical protein
MRWLRFLACAGSFAAVGLGGVGTAPRAEAPAPAPAAAPEAVKLECRAQGGPSGAPVLSFEVVLRPIPERPGHYRLELDTGVLATAPAAPAPAPPPAPAHADPRLTPPADLQPVLMDPFAASRRQLAYETIDPFAEYETVDPFAQPPRPPAPGPRRAAARGAELLDPFGPTPRPAPGR